MACFRESRPPSFFALLSENKFRYERFFIRRDRDESVPTSIQVVPSRHDRRAVGEIVVRREK